MVNRQESTWYKLRVGAHTALPSLLMENSTHGGEGTTVDWAMVRSISCELLYAV